MDIGKIDSNLSATYAKRDDAVWYSPLNPPFTIHGVFYDEEAGMFLRVPRDVSCKISDSVTALARTTAGGRVRFKTDSPYVSIYCRAPRIKHMPHMPITGSHGLSVYCNGRYAGKMMPSVDEVVSPHAEGILFGGIATLNSNGMSEIEIYMPLYGGIKELKIGVKEGSVIEPPRDYKYKAPIVIYGSSITQGACASRPGNDFAMRLSRLLDADVINLGFSGSGNAEPAMLEYLAGLDASAYIFDYNFYLSRPERVLPPHFDVYMALREKNPKTPILMIDKPGYMFAGRNYAVRSEMIRSTYEKAVALGDGLVDFMDAKELFGDECPEDCLVDTDHPNDLGFYRMAENIYPKLRRLLLAADTE